MQTAITARHFELTPQLKDFVIQKVAKLEHYSHYIMSAEIVLVRDAGQELVEGKLHLRHDVLAARAEGKDLYQATTELIDRLATQLKRHDERLRDRKKGGSLRHGHLQAEPGTD
jgi:putative sigma-54 modulation protein